MSISIAMATYNGEKYIAEQLESILLQSTPPHEIVICDDKSTDNTAEIVKSFAEKSSVPIRFYQNSTNLGWIKNFNQCIGLCSGDVIFFCDQDDVWLPNKIEIMHSAFLENPNAVLVCSDAYVVDEKLNPIADSHWKKIAPWASLSRQEFFETVARSLVCPPGFCIAVKKQYILDVLPFNEGHDFLACLYAPLYGDVICIGQPLAKYRRHANTATNYLNPENKIRKFFGILFSNTKKEYRTYFCLHRTEPTDRDIALLEKCKQLNVSDIDYSFLQQPEDFYHILAEAEHQNTARRIKTLISTYRSGLYQKFRGGPKTLLIDIRYLLISPFFRRKSKEIRN